MSVKKINQIQIQQDPKRLNREHIGNSKKWVQMYLKKINQIQQDLLNPVRGFN